MQKSNGLLCGGLQGALFSVLLLGATVVSGNAMAGTQWARAALLLFCGCVGGCLGILRAEKARRTH
jgi:putative membrane protein (TIGR04086 family)